MEFSIKTFYFGTQVVLQFSQVNEFISERFVHLLFYLTTSDTKSCIQRHNFFPFVYFRPSHLSHLSTLSHSFEDRRAPEFCEQPPLLEPFIK